MWEWPPRSPSFVGGTEAHRRKPSPNEPSGKTPHKPRTPESLERRNQNQIRRTFLFEKGLGRCDQGISRSSGLFSPGTSPLCRNRMEPFSEARPTFASLQRQDLPSSLRRLGPNRADLGRVGTVHERVRLLRRKRFHDIRRPLRNTRNLSPHRRGCGGCARGGSIPLCPLPRSRQFIIVKIRPAQSDLSGFFADIKAE